MSDTNITRDSLLAEKQEMERQRDQALKMSAEVPALEDLAEMERILGKQKEYRDSLGLFKGSERRRMDDRIRHIEEEMELKKMEVIIQQERYESLAADLELGIEALEIELERYHD